MSGQKVFELRRWFRAVRPDRSLPLAVRVIEAGHRRPLLDWAELWQFREVVFFLVWRAFKVRYRQTFLGIFWAVLQPLIGMGVYTVVFGRLVGVPSEGVPYPLFVLCGLVPWLFASKSITAMTTSLVGNYELVQRIYFPRIAIPAAAMLTLLVDMALGWLIVAGALAFYGVAPPVQILLAPVFIILLLAVAFGVGLIAAAVNVRFRDVGHLVPFALQTFMFLTPVVYPASLLPDVWRIIYAINPMVGIVGGFRWCILGIAPDAITVAISIACTAALLLSGLAVFARREMAFADYI